jgi:mannose-6-phosphate isomerase
MLGPFRIIPTVQNYSWGKRGNESALAPLLESVSPDLPYAELWVGSHSSGTARLDSTIGLSLRSDQSNLPSPFPSNLRALIESEPLLCLGEKIVRTYGELPFLLKVLSVAEPLSIQAHPDRILGEELHQKDPTHYPDRNHKPEMGIALTPVHLLCGFKGREEIGATLQRHPTLRSLLPEEVVSRCEGKIASIAEDELRYAVYRSLLTAPSIERSRVADKILRTIIDHGPIGIFEPLIPTLINTYGGDDIGIISGLLLNEVIIEPGKALFIGPNIPHAYLWGDLIECMAASDNVVRAGLTCKYQDVDTLLSMLDYRAGRPTIIEPHRFDDDESKTALYPAPVEEFFVSVTSASNQPSSHQTDGSPEILLILAGRAEIKTADVENIHLDRGNGLFVPASVSHYEISPHECTYVRVSIPDTTSPQRCTD